MEGVTLIENPYYSRKKKETPSSRSHFPTSNYRSQQNLQGLINPYYGSRSRKGIPRESNGRDNNKGRRIPSDLGDIISKPAEKREMPPYTYSRSALSRWDAYFKNKSRRIFPWAEAVLIIRIRMRSVESYGAEISRIGPGASGPNSSPGGVYSNNNNAMSFSGTQGGNQSLPAFNNEATGFSGMEGSYTNQSTNSDEYAVLKAGGYSTQGNQEGNSSDTSDINLGDVRNIIGFPNYEKMANELIGFLNKNVLVDETIVSRSTDHEIYQEENDHPAGLGGITEPISENDKTPFNNIIRMYSSHRWKGSYWPDIIEIKSYFRLKKVMNSIRRDKEYRTLANKFPDVDIERYVYFPHNIRRGVSGAGIGTSFARPYEIKDQKENISSSAVKMVLNNNSPPTITY